MARRKVRHLEARRARPFVEPVRRCGLARALLALQHQPPPLLLLLFLLLLLLCQSQAALKGECGGGGGEASKFVGGAR